MAAVLTILGVTGRILLGILIAVLILIALVLLVPVRYVVRADGGSSRGVEAEGTVTWLFRALKVTFSFAKDNEGSRTGMDLRVFGISLKELKDKRIRRRMEKRKAVRKKHLDRIRRKDPGRFEQLRKEALERKKERQAARKDETEEEAESKQTETGEAIPGNRVARKQRRRQKRISFAANLVILVRKLLRHAAEAVALVISKILALPPEIAGRISAAARKAASVCRTVSGWTDFLSDRRTGRAVRKLKKTAFILLRHTMPKKAEGRAEFGFDDPALTGEAAGIAYALRPVYGDRLVLTPVFTEQGIDGNVSAAGRVILLRVAAAVIPAVLDRNVRYCYYFIKNRNKEVSE